MARTQLRLLLIRGLLSAVIAFAAAAAVADGAYQEQDVSGTKVGLGAVDQWPAGGGVVAWAAGTAAISGDLALYEHHHPPVLTLIDRDGDEWLGRGGSVSWPRSGAGTAAGDLRAYAFPVFPRRDATLHFRAYSDWTGEWVEFSAPNPARDRYDTWAPQPLPITRAAGDLRVTLTSLGPDVALPGDSQPLARSGRDTSTSPPTGAGFPVPRVEPNAAAVPAEGKTFLLRAPEGKGFLLDPSERPPASSIAIRRPWFADTWVSLRVEQHGRLVTEWRPVAVTPSDATGNRIQTGVSWAESRAAELEITVRGQLPIGEAAWEVGVELSRASRGGRTDRNVAGCRSRFVRFRAKPSRIERPVP